MKTLNETYKATFSNGNTEIVSAWNELQAKQYFKRQFCKDSDGEANGITIESLEKVTNHNGSPAPTDWGKEFTRLTEMREKAISEMQNHIPQGRACTLSIPSRHGHIITVLNLPDNGIGFVTEESNITLWPHKVDTEYLFQAAYAVASTTFN